MRWVGVAVFICVLIAGRNQVMDAAASIVSAIWKLITLQ